ncbi:MAG: TolC family outer membrane protein [Pseudomonadota bacterium]
MGASKRFLGALIGAICVTGSAGAEDLIDIYELAIDSDPALQAARARQRSTNELERQAFSNFLPQISGSASMNQGTNEFSIAGNLVNDQDTDTERLGVDLRQSIYDHGNFKQLDISRAQGAQAESNYQVALQDFVLRGAERYFAVLTAEDGLDFAKAEERAVGRQLEQAEQRYEVGLTAITDVHEAQASFDNARARVIVAENQLNDALEALAELAGQLPDDRLDELQEELPTDMPEPVDREAWVGMAIENNPALQSRREAVEIAEETVALNRSDFYPTLSATVSYSEFTNNEFILRDDLQRPIATVDSVSEDASIGVQLNVPIYTGGRTNSRVRQAVADLEAAQEDYEAEYRAVVRQTRNAFRGTEASILEVEARRQALISAESALEATEAGFEVGTRTIVDVLLSQQRLFQAQRDHSQSRHEYILNILRLKLSAGVLTREDIEEINALLVTPAPETAPTT